jgi:hypothetical protein
MCEDTIAAGHRDFDLRTIGLSLNPQTSLSRTQRPMPLNLSQESEWRRFPDVDSYFGRLYSPGAAL